MGYHCLAPCGGQCLHFHFHRNLQRLSGNGKLGGSLVKRLVLGSEVRRERVGRSGELGGGLVVAERRSDGKHVDVVGAPVASLRLLDVGLGLVDVAEEQVRGGVAREHWRRAARWELVQLLVEVVRLVEGAGSRLEPDPRLDRLDQRAVVTDALGGSVLLLGEVAAVEREQKLGKQRDAVVSPEPRG